MFLYLSLTHYCFSYYDLSLALSLMDFIWFQMGVSVRCKEKNKCKRSKYVAVMGGSIKEGPWKCSFISCINMRDWWEIDIVLIYERDEECWV